MQSDVRLGLHGQEGLQAKSLIPRGTVIGPMKGTLMTAAEYHRCVSRTMCNGKS